MVNPVRTSQPGWSHFSHAADIGIEGHGPSLAIAFEQAAIGLLAAVTASEVKPQIKVAVACQAPAKDLLFVDWLNAIIYEMATRRMLFGRFHVEIAGDRLAGTLWGETVDPSRHQPACEPKGATYTQLAVAENADGSWSCRCVVDV